MPFCFVVSKKYIPEKFDLMWTWGVLKSFFLFLFIQTPVKEKINFLFNLYSLVIKFLLSKKYTEEEIQAGIREEELRDEYKIKFNVKGKRGRIK